MLSSLVIVVEQVGTASELLVDGERRKKLEYQYIYNRRLCTVSYCVAVDGDLAQLVEHRIPVPKVAGSSPVVLIFSLFDLISFIFGRGRSPRSPASCLQTLSTAL